MKNINWLAVVVAAVAMFVLGAIWYNVLSAQWIAASGVNMEEAEKANMAVTMGLGFLTLLVSAYFLAYFLRGAEAGASTGLRYGLCAGFGFAAMAVAIGTLYEMRPMAYFLINGGYFVVGYAIMGAIIGAWRKKPAVSA